ncbi:GntR family transcriptional regulator [Streptomyces sp. NPDC001508]|uniref:GntR family transcriptional regulator n=1 Tax=Streptomyces sp. NPDC001508 TaxID=3154656 RepID=UPI0033227623
MTAAQPTYLVLADQIAEEIADWPPGKRLASEVDLAERYSVSRLTARAALQELERRYLVRRAKGSGTYVAERVDYLINSRFTSWSEMVRKAGATPSRPTVGVNVIRPSEEIRDRLRLPADARVVELVRLGLVNDVVANLNRSYLPVDLAPGFPDLLANGAIDLAPVLSSIGYRLKRLWARAELATPDPETARALQVEGRPPLWLVINCVSDATTGRRLQLSYAWNRPDVLHVQFEFGNPD